MFIQHMHVWYRRHQLLDRGVRHRVRRRPAAVPGPVLRLRHGRVLPRQRQARSHHLRRSVQAGRRLPSGLLPSIFFYSV